MINYKRQCKRVTSLSWRLSLRRLFGLDMRVFVTIFISLGD